MTRIIRLFSYLQGLPGVLAGCLTVAMATMPALAAGDPIRVAASIDHGAFDRLLTEYVDGDGLVDYTGWHASEGDRQALADYLAQFAKVEGPEAGGAARHAALVNAYNAFTIQWILENFPTESIMNTPRPFKEARWLVDGRRVSLDAIEHEGLRPEMGWEVHSVIVCAALSCPPLQRRAATPDNLDAMVATGYRAWLAREDLNAFHPRRGVAKISKIFKWFSEDFEAVDGGLATILARFAPEQYQGFLREGDFRVKYQGYDWTLNAQSNAGEQVSGGFLDGLF
jgi:hypothetical protein